MLIYNNNKLINKIERTNNLNSERVIMNQDTKQKLKKLIQIY